MINDWDMHWNVGYAMLRTSLDFAELDVQQESQQLFSWSFSNCQGRISKTVPRPRKQKICQTPFSLCPAAEPQSYKNMKPPSSPSLSTETFQHGLAGPVTKLLQAHVGQALEVSKGAAGQHLPRKHLETW